MRIATPAAVGLILAGCVAGGPVEPAPETRTAGISSPHPSATPSASASNSASDSHTDASGSGASSSNGVASPDPSTAGSSGTRACTAALGDGCGAYDYAGIPNSNGSNTYVSNQAVGPQAGTTQTVYVNHPGDWRLVAHAVPRGYRGVQTFPDVQQLFNNWCGQGWGDCPSPASTPLDALSSLKVSYRESPPALAKSINEFAVDVWSESYGSDIMFWTDTRGRCDEGAFGSTVLGHAVIGGQGWTVHRYGDPGDEIIFVLDGPGGRGTCAQQPAGTVDVKAGLDWLTANGLTKGPHTLTQVNTGWEITSADDATFAMHGYSIEAVPK